MQTLPTRKEKKLVQVYICIYIERERMHVINVINTKTYQLMFVERIRNLGGGVFFLFSFLFPFLSFPFLFSLGSFFILPELYRIYTIYGK